MTLSDEFFRNKHVMGAKRCKVLEFTSILLSWGHCWGKISWTGTGSAKLPLSKNNYICEACIVWIILHCCIFNVFLYNSFWLLRGEIEMWLWHYSTLQDEVLCLEGEIVMTCREFLNFVVSTYPESKGKYEQFIIASFLTLRQYTLKEFLIVIAILCSNVT